MKVGNTHYKRIINRKIQKSEFFHDNYLHIAFHSPIGWVFHDLNKFDEEFEKQQFGAEWENEEDKIVLKNILGKPLCIITKYDQDEPENYGKFSPTITINVSKNDYKGLWGMESFSDLVSRSRQNTSSILKDFTSTKPIKKIKDIGNAEGYIMESSYTFEHIELPQQIRVELITVLLERPDWIFDFNMHQSTEVGEIAENEFKNFIKSIVIK